jgi:hypothetical protein
VATLWESAKERLGVVLVTGAASVATIFSDHIVASIKTGVNKADQRPSEQRLIATDISNFVFTAENVLESLGMGLTSKAQLHFVVDPYNDAIVTLRKNEYVYLGAVRRYWGQSAVEAYQSFFADVRAADQAVHAFNPQFSLVESGTEAKADDAKVKALLPKATLAVSQLESSAKKLLMDLSD